MSSVNVSPYIYCMLLVYINVTNTVPKVTFLIDQDSDERKTNLGGYD